MGKIKAHSLKRLRTRRSVKWRAFPQDVLPLPIAEMDFPIAKPIRAVLIDMIERSDLGYSGIIPELPKAFADYSLRNWGWHVDQSQVRLANDVGVAGVELLRILTQPGDKVVLNSPVYLNFYSWITEANCSLVDVPLLPQDGEWVLNFEGLEAAFAQGAKVYLLCNPHNPVGTVYTKDELEQIADLAHKYSVIVISDEIHAPLTYVENKFIPYLSVSRNAATTGICITAASKSWNLAGLKCAQIISADSAMFERLNRLPISGPWRSSILGTWASVAAYNESEKWLDSILETLDENRYYLADLLREYLPKAKYVIPESTYLAWVDLSEYQIEKIGEHILEHARVALSHGHEFGPNSAGFVRINFATSQSILKEAIVRISRVLESV